MPGLCATGRGAGEAFNESADSDEEAPNKYIHIQACGPGGIADADGGFAEKIYNHSVKYASRKPAGFVEFPRDWLRVQWSPGEISTRGGADYYVAFGEQTQQT